MTRTNAGGSLKRLGWATVVTTVLVTTGVARASWSVTSTATPDAAAQPVLANPAGVGAGLAAPTAQSRYALLIADNLSRRILITDYDGNIVWQWRNPTGLPSRFSGPLGVRWVGTDKILATFGTGEVGLIDVHAKKFDWVRTSADGEYFKSPYDAQILPDGNLAVVTRYNHGGQVAVYDRTSGQRVWQVLADQPHTMLYLGPKRSWHTSYPSIMVGAKGSIGEYTYRPGHTPKLVWQQPSRWPHDLVSVGDGTFLSQDGTYTRRFTRTGGQAPGARGHDLWRFSSYGLPRRFAIDPADPGLFVMAGGSEDSIQFRRLSDGSLVHKWSRLGDHTRLDWPYGVRVVSMKQVLRAR